MGNFQGGDRGRGGFRGGHGGGKPNFQNRNWSDKGGRDGAMFKATCAQCQKECEVPFRPTGDRPVYCSECFGSQRGEQRGGRNDFSPRGGKHESASHTEHKTVAQDDATKKQLADITSKLDRIVSMLAKMAEPAREVVQAVAEVKALPEKKSAKVAAPAKAVKVAKSAKKATKPKVAPKKKAGKKK